MAEDTGVLDTSGGDQNNGGDTSSAGKDIAPGATGENKGTALENPSDKGSLTPGDWPADWRERIAGNDEKELARLQRMASPDAVWKASRELEKKISSGEYRKVINRPGADATPEDLAAWRKEAGLPTKPEEYSLKLREGFVPSKDDQPLLDNFKQMAFDSDISPEVGSKMAQWYFDQQEQLQAKQLEADYASKEGAEEALRREFGNEYKLNMGVTKSFLESTFGNDLAGMLLTARDQNGVKLGNNPDIVKALVRIARENAPGLGLVPAGTENVGASIQSELDNISKLRKEDPQKYWGDNALLARERELIDAQMRQKMRA